MSHIVDLKVHSKYAYVGGIDIERRHIYLGACESLEDGERLPIVKIDIDTLEIEYIDQDAKLDAYAQVMIINIIDCLKR